MVLEELTQYFIDSRKRGVTGAKKRCSAKTITIYQDNLRCFMNYMQSEVDGGGITKYESIRKLHVMQFLDWLDKKVEGKAEGRRWSLSTKLQILRTLRTFFRWVDKDEDAQAEGLRGLQRYLPTIGKCPRRQDIPQNSQLKKFKNGFNTDGNFGYRDYVACCLLMDTGIRLGELCSLTLSHTLLDEKILFIEGKTGSRSVAITEEMARMLKGWLKRRVQCRHAADSPYVFVSKYGPQLSVSGFSQVFRKKRKKLGLPRISAHTFRHAFATNYLRNGGNMEKLRLMTGHSSYEMLKDYLHLAKIGGKEQQEELERCSLLKEMQKGD